MNKRLLYRKAQDLWGLDKQLNMVFEECGELITALSRLIRGRGGTILLAGEIADVEIMLDQLKYIYNIHEVVEGITMDKLERLKERLDESGG